MRIPAAHGPCPLGFCSAFPFPCLALWESLSCLCGPASRSVCVARFSFLPPKSYEKARGFSYKVIVYVSSSMLRYDTSSHATPLRQTPVREQQHVWWHLPDLCLYSHKQQTNKTRRPFLPSQSLSRSRPVLSPKPPKLPDSSRVSPSPPSPQALCAWLVAFQTPITWRTMGRARYLA